MSNPYIAPDNSDLPQPSAELKQPVRGLQIITVGLAMGVLVFMGIALAANKGAIDGQPGVLSWVGLGLAVLMLILYWVIPNTLSGTALKNIDPQDLRAADEATRLALIVQVFQVRHIVACALLEGAAFMNLVAYLTEQSVGNLAAAAILVVFLVIRLPSVSSVQCWVQDRVREIEMR